MKIAFNPSNSSKNILDLIKNNKDIIFDLKGHSIYARGVEFKGTDTNTWRPVVDNLTSNSATSSLSANQGRVLAGLINGKSDSGHNHDGRYLKLTGGTMLLGEGLKFHANNNYFGTNADARIISLLDNNDKICDGGLIIDERATLDGKEYVTELLRIRDSEFKWKGSNILHSGNSYINGSTITINGSSLSVIDQKVTQTSVSSGYTDFRAVLITAETSSASAGYTPNTVIGKTLITNALQLSPQAGNLYLKGSAAIGTTNFSRKLNVNGDIGLLNTGSIRDLAIGGGIYWYPYVESSTDGSDAASITVVKSGVAGGTTLVLSQMNDASDTIQFKTNTAARLYHNSYPILTTQNTYVSNNKGYINGTEITQVNNADKLDGWHKDNIQQTGYITSPNSLASYWFKMYDITVTRWQYNDITITFLVSAGYSVNFSIFYLRIRQNGTNNSGNYNLGVSLYELVGNLRDKVVVYYNNSTGNVQLWGNIGGQWGTLNYTILKKTFRTDVDSPSLGTLTAQSFSSVQTPPSTGYSKVTMARLGSVSYSDSTGSVHWNNVTNKPSTFNPASHTHTWTSITDKIVAGNEFNVVNAGYNSTFWFNYLPINDRGSKATISTYYMGNGQQGCASVTASGFIKNGGNQEQLLRADGGVAAFNWSGQSGQPTWLWGGNNFNSYYVYNPSNFRVAYAASAGNAETLGGEHASNFVRAGNFESANLNSLDTYSFIKSVNSNVASASPNGNTGWYNVIQAVHRNGASNGPNYIGQIALGMTTNLSAMFYRIKYKGSWYAWNEVVTTNTGLLRYSRNNVNISSPNCSPIPPSLLEWTVGYPRLYDPEFNEGDNKVWVYNNAGNGVVTVTRVHDTNVGNSSSYVMKVVSAAGASPNYGGWHVQTQTELGKVYTCLFRALIPSGVEIEWNSNSIGTGGQMSWLTNNMGTGKWTWYAVQVYCGSGGSTTFYFSAKSPCTWYLSYVNVIENNRASYAGLRSVYSDYLKANASIVFGRNELQYFNQYTGVTSGATNNANPKTDWYHILRMNHANNSGYFVDLAIPFHDNRIQFRRITNGSDNGWRRVITEEPNHNVVLCDGSSGGNVGIAISNPSQRLDVNGHTLASGFIHRYHQTDDAILLAGGGYMIYKTGTTSQSTAIQFGKYVWIMLQVGHNGQVVPNNISKPPDSIYVTGNNCKWRISPDGNIRLQDGNVGSYTCTTICYVASS